jgi:putative tricarboxylic transport membrane protein
MLKLKPAIPETIVSLVVIVFSGLVYWQTTIIPVSRMNARVGATIMPYLTSIILAFLGLALLWQALNGGWVSDEEKALKTEMKPAFFFGLGLVLNVLLIGPLGFTIASTLMFMCIAYSFGSRNHIKNALIAATFALTAYFGFAKLLGINIGAGLIEGFLDQILFGVK